MVPTGPGDDILSDPSSSVKVARKLSKALQKVVLWFFLFDENEASFALFSDGKQAAVYNFDHNYTPDKGLSKVPALIGLEESYRKRLAKIVACTDAELQTQLLEEYFGVKLLLLPEMLEEDPNCAVCSRRSALFDRYDAENRVPTGKKAPIQVKQVFELEGVVSDADWDQKYHQAGGYLWVFRKHYWLYAPEKATGIEQRPVCFRAGKLSFISDEEMLRDGADRRYNETRQKDPLFEQLYSPSMIQFSESAPEPYSGRTVKLPRTFYGLGFDKVGRFFVFNEANCFALIDENGKMLAKQHVKGDIIDHDGDHLLTWEEKWDTFDLNGMSILKRLYGIIRIYQVYDK
ncbi:MAG: hypothetical protein IK095_07585 [Oscillospiraceae bacterium]|nr:hypothetical protein [Oscillospiraceae bacterium]